MTRTTTGGGTAGSVSGREMEALFMRLRPALLRFFERRTQAPEDAEDMTQEVFLRITRLCDTQPVWHPEGFLFQTAANVLRDRGRRESVRQRWRHRLRRIMRADDTEVPSEESLYEEKETAMLFLAALSELTPKCRMIFLLHKYEGLSYSEIALRFGVSVSAIEKHMARALRHIRKRREEGAEWL